MRRTMRSDPMALENDEAGPAHAADDGARGPDVPGAVPTDGQPYVTPEEQLPTAVVDELFSILSHELRAPLTTIKGSSRTLLRHGAVLDPAAARQLLQDIDQEADRMHRLVDNLLELARAGVGKNAL